ncbi:MAG: hypothetical protein ABIX01_19950 [Chitinophagaceae bacterium]
MGLHKIDFSVLLPVLFLSLPFYFIAKFLEQKIKPRTSGKRFLTWVLAVLVSAFVYFFVLVGFYIRFIHPRLFHN